MTAPAWLDALRRESAKHFDELGFPTTRLEDWRYTNVSQIASTRWTRGGPRHEGVDRPELEQLCFPVFACSLFVFVNGHFAADLSTPRAQSPGVRVRSLARALREEPDTLRGRLGSILDTKTRAFAAWNTADLADGALVEIGRDLDLAEPIHLVFLAEPGGDPTVSHPRVWIEAGSGSRASVIEDYVSFGEGRFLTNAVSEVAVAPGARLEHVRLQREGAQGTHVSSLRVEVERDGRLACFAIALGGGLVRNELDVALLGEGAECDLFGVFVGTGRRHVDNHTRIDHAVPHTTSRELYKGILAGHARGIFDGRIVVRPGAVKSDARQQSKNLLLSAGAEIDTKPQLEIRADDVRCSHGSTIGRLDPDAVFYLRARGIDERDARVLLTRAFSAEVTDAMRFEALRESVQDQIEALLEAEA